MVVEDWASSFWPLGLDFYFFFFFDKITFLVFFFSF